MDNGREHGARVSSRATTNAREDTGAPGPKGWHSRGYLRHYDSNFVVQMVTFRLADSLPAYVAERLAGEPDTTEGNPAYRERIEAWIDAGHGECLLNDPWIAQVVEDSLRFFHGTRYRLHAWIIMPNHVHVLLEMLSPHSLGSTVKGWKSFTARQINERLGRSGKVWQKDYWDRYMRNEQQYAYELTYIHENPVTAGLVARAEPWRWSSIREERAYVHAPVKERPCPHGPDADGDIGAPERCP